MLEAIDKKALLTDLLVRLHADLDQVTAAQRATAAGATHEENRAEGDKDMRATEVSYVARGQAERVMTLREEVARSEAVAARTFTEDTPVALGALIGLEDESGAMHHHLLMPGGAGLELEPPLPGGALKLSVISSRSPIGQALLGTFQGDELNLELAGKSRCWEIVEVA